MKKLLFLLLCSAAMAILMPSCGSMNNAIVNKIWADADFVSNPEGALIYDNSTNAYLGMTPCKLKLSREAVKKGNASFRFEREGYKARTVTVDPAESKSKNVTVSATLKKNNLEPERVSRDNAGRTEMERSIIRWMVDSDPRGARVFYRVISSVPDEVKNTNEVYLGTTPYEETRSFNIMGLTYDNSQDVTIELKISKRGYEDQVKRFNVRMALDQQEVSGFFELVEK